MILAFGVVSPVLSDEGKCPKAPAEGADANFYGSLIKNITSGLIRGASGKIGSDIMGQVLKLLGWGDDQNSAEVKALTAMDKKLGEILTELGFIECKLEELMTQLKITEEEILANANDPTDAITLIGTFHSELQQTAKDKKPGDGDQGGLNAFARQIENNFQIENDVNTIFSAIKPATVARTPVLQNFTDLLNLRYHLGDGTLFDAYKTLELYTSQLVYNQLKGVNLVVEAKNLLQGKAAALTYMQSYQKDILENEIGNPANGVSFISNVWRLAMMNVDLLPSDGKSFFSSDILSFLKRAEFYRRLTLGENPGLRVLLIKTQDMPEDYTLTAVNSEWAFPLDCTKPTSVTGKTYDFWVSGNHVKPGTDYDVYECTTSATLSLGAYKIYHDTEGSPLAELTLENYDEDYNVKVDGDLTFGFAAVLVRTALNHYPEGSTHWTTHHEDSDNTKITDGSANDWPYELTGDADGDHGYEGWAELRAYFYFSGDSEQTLIVDYSAELSGHATAHFHNSTGGSDAHAKYHIAVWDTTKGERVTDTHSEHSFSESDGNHQFSKVSSGTMSFKAVPGHHYRTYVWMRVHGCCNDDTESQIRVERFSYIHIRFD